MKITKLARVFLLLTVGIGCVFNGFAQTPRTATAVAEISQGGWVSIIKIIDAGAGYPDFQPAVSGTVPYAPKVTLKGGGGSGAEAVVDKIETGSIVKIYLATCGNGYTSAPVVEIQPPQEVLALKQAVDAKEAAQQKAEAEDKARQRMESLKPILQISGLILLGAFVVAGAFWAKKSKSIGELGNKPLISKKVVLPVVAIIALGFGVYSYNYLQNLPPAVTVRVANESSDPDPTGTWTAGDKNSVYNRLTVKSSGTFKFETVDFTGDVKDGYYGTWQMDGNSVRFSWGKGGADSGSCSGRKTGENSLVFGSTTFGK